MAGILGSAASSSTDNGTTASATYTIPAGQNRVIIAILAHETTTNRTHSSVYFDTGGDNVAMTNVSGASGAVDTGSIQNRTSVWILNESGIPTGTGSVTVTGTASGATVGGIGIVVFALENAKHFVEASTFKADTSSVTHISDTITATLNSMMICAVNHAIDTAAQTPDSPQTSLIDYQVDNDCRLAISYEVCTSEGSQTLGSTAANPGHCCVSVFNVGHLLAGGEGSAMTPVLMI